uniref:polycystin-1-like protein 1 n=1 Tax=Panthera onca TaxID=9690 RepID=UPI00295467C3
MGTDEGRQTVIMACPLPCRLVFPGPNPSLPGSDPSSSANRGRGDGDNLLGPLPPTAAAGPPLMVDWPKSLVGRTLFHSYTASGITGQTVTIKPFALSPGKTYVLQASV